MELNAVICKKCNRLWTLNDSQRPAKPVVSHRLLGTCYCGVDLYNPQKVTPFIR